MVIDFQPLFEQVNTPEYATDGSAGFDLVAHNFKKHFPRADNSGMTDEEISKLSSLTLMPGSRALIGCGYAVAVPKGFEMQVRPRSGLALKGGITVVNTPGTIDSDYRGEIGVILINHGSKPFVIALGDKIAQAVITSYEKTRFNRVPSLSSTERGQGGFGSTDKPNL